jgi:hypothetical protein
VWRRDVAIPALAAAGLDWFDPQVADGGWSAEAHEARDVVEKTRADLLLFVIDGTTRAVASLAEIAYIIASGRPLALAVADVAEDAVVDGIRIGPRERDDLNRGRLFVRTVAAQHGIPCFADAAGAVAHAVALAGRLRAPLDLAALRAIVGNLECGDFRFLAEDEGGLLTLSVERDGLRGRRWVIERDATPGEVAQSALKAVLTWGEHEVREQFRYRAERVFSPHRDLDALAALARSRR